MGNSALLITQKGEKKMGRERKIERKGFFFFLEREREGREHEEEVGEEEKLLLSAISFLLSFIKTFF